MTSLALQVLLLKIPGSPALVNVGPRVRWLVMDQVLKQPGSDIPEAFQMPLEA